jgi:hypothetical protein
MLCHFNKFSRIYAALVLGGAGIAGLIDQATMIVLVVVLCILPNAGCLPVVRKA